jgi:hypothetical protein
VEALISVKTAGLDEIKAVQGSYFAGIVRKGTNLLK